ncbi:MAG: hypothetical protein OXN21_16100 [Chloroflexota bacterium]|nr:hypothetical protein [Chloroflexota bacterium]
MATKRKKPRGRPVERVLPEPVKVPTDELVRTVLKMPNKTHWRYLEKVKEEEKDPG